MFCIWTPSAYHFPSRFRLFSHPKTFHVCYWFSKFLCKCLADCFVALSLLIYKAFHDSVSWCSFRSVDVVLCDTYWVSVSVFHFKFWFLDLDEERPVVNLRTEVHSWRLCRESGMLHLEALLVRVHHLLGRWVSRRASIERTIGIWNRSLRYLMKLGLRLVDGVSPIQWIRRRLV